MTSYRTMSTVQVSEQTFMGNGTSTTEDIPQRSFVQYDISDTVQEVVSPVILLFGTFGNMMTVLVLRTLRSEFGDPSMCFYFTCLAVYDQTVLTLGLGRIWIRSTFLYDVRTLHVVVCKLHKFLVFSVSRMASWILVAVSTERVRAVVWPLHQSLSNVKKRAKTVVLVIMVFCCLVDSGILVVYYPQTMNGKTKCKPVKDSPQVAFYQDKVVPWLNTMTGSCLPFVILVVNNIILVYKVRQSAKACLYKMDPQRALSRTKHANSISITLIVTSIAFIVLSSPIPAYFIIRRVILSSPPDAKLEADLFLVESFIDLLIYCSNAVNFYLYLLTVSTVRKAARRWLCCCQKLPSRSQITSPVKGQITSPAEGMVTSPAEGQIISPTEGTMG